MDNNNLPLPPQMTITNKLPKELCQKIYQDHFSVDVRYKNFQEAITSKASKSLIYWDNQIYREQVRIVLKDRELLEYVLQKHPEFRNFYEDIFIKRKRHFIKITDPIDDLALCWLFRLYH